MLSWKQEKVFDYEFYYRISFWLTDALENRFISAPIWTTKLYLSRFLLTLSSRVKICTVIGKNSWIYFFSQKLINIKRIQWFIFSSLELLTTEVLVVYEFEIQEIIFENSDQKQKSTISDCTKLFFNARHLHYKFIFNDV